MLHINHGWKQIQYEGGTHTNIRTLDYFGNMLPKQLYGNNEVALNVFFFLGVYHTHIAIISGLLYFSMLMC